MDADYRTVFFMDVKATGTEVATILSQIAFGRGIDRLLVCTGTDNYISGYGPGKTNDDNYPDFTIFSKFLDGGGAVLHNHTIKYNVKTFSAIYFSALEQRLKDEEKIIIS